MPPKGAPNIEWTPDIQKWMRELKEAGDERLDLEVRKRWRESAADARGRIRGAAQGAHPQTDNTRPSSAGTHWGDLVNSIKSGADGKTPFVSIGSKRVPWALGFEFGSNTYRQFPPWKGSGADAGYFFWPTFVGMRPEIVRDTEKALEDAFDKAFPKG